VNNDLGDQVCRDLDSCCLKGEAEIEGADHGAMTLGTKKRGLLRSHEREGQTSE
jgi:hypothetical protein